MKLKLSLLIAELLLAAVAHAEAPQWRLWWHIGGSGSDAPMNVGAIGPHNRLEPPVRTWGEFNERFIRPARAWAELHDEPLNHYVWEPWGIPGYEPGTGRSRLIFSRLAAHELGLTYLTRGWPAVFDEARGRGENLVIHIGCPPARHRNPDETPRWDRERARGPEFLALYAREMGEILPHVDGVCLDNASSATRLHEPSRRFVIDSLRLVGKQPWTEAGQQIGDEFLHGLPCMTTWKTYRVRSTVERSPVQEGVYPLEGTPEFDQVHGEVLVPIYDYDVPFDGVRRVNHQYTREYMAAVGKWSREVSSHGVTVGLSHLHVEGAIRHGLGPQYFYEGG